MSTKVTKLAHAGKLEIKLSSDETMSFSGYGAVYGNVDFAYDILSPGAFTKTLAEHKERGTTPAMFFNHDSYAVPIGIWDVLEEDDYGLKVSGRFLDTTAGRDAYIATKAGAVTGLSIGFYVTDAVMEGDTRVIHEVSLLEISVVTFPCNSKARVSDVKTAPEETSDEEFLKALDDLGIDEEDAKAMLAKRNKSIEDEPTDDEEKVDDGIVDEEVDEEASDDAEAKYIQTAISAVEKLIREIKQENHGRNRI